MICFSAAPMIARFSTYLFLASLCLNITPRQTSAQTRNGHADHRKYWVFFSDKLSDEKQAEHADFSDRMQQITQRAQQRRGKASIRAQKRQWYDTPVSGTYLARLAQLGYEPMVSSRWLNAASLLLKETDVRRIEALPFVRNVRPVGKFVDTPVPAPKSARPQQNVQQQHTYDYGSSFTQNELINVPAVHDLGITGVGILIGVLDTGFKYRTHEAFLEMNIIAEFDFIDNDDITEDEPGKDPSGQHSHGTRTLSTVGGFQEGQLIGPAFDASFILGKTEDISQEVPAEEDYWIAGIEWFEAQGVDVVTSSLGYIDFYDTSDMDGNTAVITVAADIAAGLGVVVVNSAGNEGNSVWRIMIAPADGDSVIAVGAVDASNQITSFSSVGPTADGRIKPDVVAMGTLVYTASPAPDVSNSTYALVSGTSFSCPLVAGVAALVLSTHPQLTPMEVRDALRLTADRAANPDISYGWGLVDAYQAVLYHGMAFSNLPEMAVNTSAELKVSIKVTSQFGIDPTQVFLVYARSDGNFNNEVMMAQGTEAHQYTATFSTLAGGEAIDFYFRAADSSGAQTVHPFNAPDYSFRSLELPVTVDSQEPSLPTAFRLQQNYPNPFNPTTTITYALAAAGEVSLKIFNILGQEIRTLLSETGRPAGLYSEVWDGTDNHGRSVATGVYVYRLEVNEFVDMKKMVLIR